MEYWVDWPRPPAHATARSACRLPWDVRPCPVSARNVILEKHTYVTYVCTCMIRVCEPWLHTRLNTVYACIHLDLALPLPRTRPRHGAPPEGEGPARRLQGAGGESGTPTRTAPTGRTTRSTWPSRARAVRGARERGRQSAEGLRVHLLTYLLNRARSAKTRLLPDASLVHFGAVVAI